MNIAIVMPVGPTEETAFHDTVCSITTWEPAVRTLVAIDDDVAYRDLRRHDIRVQVLKPPLPNADLEDRVAASFLAGVAWIARNAEADVVMKLDTDALVIAPFAAALQNAFAGEIGCVGAYRTGPSGGARSFESWAGHTRKLSYPMHMMDGKPRLAITGRAGTVRCLIRMARRHGYEWGEHALGAAVAVCREAVDRFARLGVLDDPIVFAGSRLFDDPVLGILTRAVGMRLGDHAPFGVQWRGLADAPEKLERRFSIIHSVKNDTVPEDRIRDYFRSRRLACTKEP